MCNMTTRVRRVRRQLDILQSRKSVPILRRVDLSRKDRVRILRARVRLVLSDVVVGRRFQRYLRQESVVRRISRPEVSLFETPMYRCIARGRRVNFHTRSCRLNPANERCTHVYSAVSYVRY